MENKAQEERILALEAQVAALTKQHEQDQNEIKYLKELLGLRNAMLFAKKREKVADGQMTLFDDVELTQEEAKAEEKLESVRAHTRKVKNKNAVNLTANLPLKVETVDFDNPDPASVHIGYKSVRKLVHKPEEYYILETRYETRKIENEYGETKFITTAPDTIDDSAMANTMVDNSVVSHVIYNKCVMSLPLYRQEQDLSRKGIGLSRQTMSNEIYKAAKALTPVVNLITDYIKSADNNRADETPLNIIEINGEKARLADSSKTKNSYVWVFMTAEGYHPAFRYLVGPSRKKEVAINFYSGCGHRYLQTDDYDAYFSLENITNVPCFSHIRRRFFKATKVGRHDYTTESGKLLSIIDEMFHAEHKILDDLKSKEGSAEYYELRKKARELTVRPLMESFFKECRRVEPFVLPKSLLATAIGYALELEDYAYNFFKDGRLVLTNNDAERNGIKSLVIGRKNWLFSNTVKGAEVTCSMYSLVETAMFNNLNPEKYLTYLLEHLPYQEKEGFDYSVYLPWSKSIPEEIKYQKMK